jgi:hypothetical protein
MRSSTMVARRAARFAGVLALGTLLGIVDARGPRLAAAADPASHLRYGLFVAGFEMLGIDVETAVGESDYRIDISMRTEGPIGIVFPWRSHSESWGLMRSSDLVPRAHRVRGSFRSQVRSVELEYQDSGQVKLVDVEPGPEADERDDVPLEMRDGTVDPLSGVMSIIEHVRAGRPCTDTLHIFDGRRRYDVVAEQVGEVQLEESSHDPYHGAALLCRASLVPIAGFWKEQGQRDTPGTIETWLASPSPGVPPTPVRISVPGRFGTSIIHLTEFNPPK